jgi:hypothetical protein
LRRGAWPALPAVALLLAASGASGEPILPGTRGGAPIWEEHGAGRTDGLAVGAYPLPPQPERRDGKDAETDSAGKERWLRRHYQWLRVLNELHSPPDASVERRTTKSGEPSGFVASTPPGALRMGDMVVLYADRGEDRSAPHLLDDGARSEDPEIGPGRVEALEFIASSGLEVEVAKIVAEYFSPLTQGLRTAFGGALLAAERQRAPRIDLAQLEDRFAAPSLEAAPGAPPRAQSQPEPVSLPGFFKAIVMDVLSAPTTYLLTLFALLGWLVLRATVFSRN